MTFRGLKLQLQSASGLYRKVDLAYPSNRFAVTVALVAGVVVAIFARDVWVAFFSAAATFCTWALGREMDPDRSRTANLGAITMGLVLSVFALNNRLVLRDVVLGAVVTGSMMVIARALTRSTGLGATALDVATLFAVALGSGLIDPQVGVILVAVATLGIAVDRALEQHPYLGNWRWFGFTLFAFIGAYFVWRSGPWLAPTGFVLALGTLNIVLALNSEPSSRSDRGTRFEPSRFIVANLLVSLAATALISHGLPLAIVGLLAVGLWKIWPHP